jgi:hypothetical protein
VTVEAVPDRFVVRHVTGYAMPDGSRPESEWTVHDTWDMWEVVASFIVRRGRGMNQPYWDRVQGQRRRRAQLVALAMNRAERDGVISYAELRARKIDGEWIAPIRVLR